MIVDVRQQRKWKTFEENGRMLKWILGISLNEKKTKEIMNLDVIKNGLVDLLMQNR